MGPSFGLVTATGFMDFTVGPRVVVGDTAQYVSLELEVLYDRSYGSPQEVSQTLEVFPTTQPFDDSIFYYNRASLALDDNPIGTVTVDTKLEGAIDTLRFRLDDALGREIFDSAQEGDSAVIVGDQFRDFLPGLALVSEAGNTFIGSFSAEGIRLIMNFTDANNEAREQTFTVRRYFHQVTGDYDGTPLSALAAAAGPITPPDQNFYLQSGTGVTPVINMDSLVAFYALNQQQDRPILLNRVDFNIGLNNANDTIDAPSSLFAYVLEEDSLGRQVRVSLGTQGNQTVFEGLGSDQGTGNVAAPIALSNNRYRIPITNYANEILNDTTLRQDLYIRANTFGSTTSQFFTVPDSVYLDVFYTVLD